MMMKVGTRLASLMPLAAMLLFSFGLAASGSTARAQSMKMKMNGRMVYVCSCMKTKSCPCMTEANMEGKCACGAKAPDMNAVPRTSAWAKANRKALRSAPPMKMKM